MAGPDRKASQEGMMLGSMPLLKVAEDATEICYVDLCRMFNDVFGRGT